LPSLAGACGAPPRKPILHQGAPLGEAAQGRALALKTLHELGIKP